MCLLFDLNVQLTSFERHCLFAGFLTVKIRLEVRSNYRQVTVEDTESLTLSGKVGFLGGNGGELEVLSPLRHSSKARRLSSSLLRALARSYVCARVHGYACVCVWSYPGNPCVCMCVYVYI